MIYHYTCTHCGAVHYSQWGPPQIAFHHKQCSDEGHYNTMQITKVERPIQGVADSAESGIGT